MQRVIRAGQRVAALVIAIAMWISPASAGSAAWSQVTLTNSFTPLENRVAVLGPGASSPDVMVFTLWTTGSNMNHLGAFIIPHPWDGSNVSFTADIDVGPLFGVGNICVLGVNQVLVPYVRLNGGNFDVFTAYFNGSTWTANAVPLTSSDDYHSADCIALDTGVHLMVLNNSERQIEYLRAPHPRSAADATAQGPFPFTNVATRDEQEYGEPPVSPFDGSPSPRAAYDRSSLFVTGTFPAEFLDEVFAGDLDGYLLIGSSSSSSIDGAYLPRNYDNASGTEQDIDLPIRRSRSPDGASGDVAWAAHNRNGLLELTRFGLDSAADDLIIPIGPINAGSQFPNFQGIAVRQAPDGRVYVLADRAWQVNTDLGVSPLAGYPFEGLGGAVSLEFAADMSVGFAAGPGSQVLGLLRAGELFSDSFE